MADLAHVLTALMRPPPSAGIGSTLASAYAATMLATSPPRVSSAGADVSVTVLAHVTGLSVGTDVLVVAAGGRHFVVGRF